MLLTSLHIQDFGQDSGCVIQQIQKGVWQRSQILDLIQGGLEKGLQIMQFNSLASPDDPCEEPPNALLLVVSVNGVPHLLHFTMLNLASPSVSETKKIR